MYNVLPCALLVQDAAKLCVQLYLGQASLQFLACHMRNLRRIHVALRSFLLRYYTILQRGLPALWAGQ